jgi:NAD+ diphosphatase
MTAARPNVFSGPYVDRRTQARKDAAAVAEALSDPAAQLVPVWRHRSLVRSLPEPQAVLLSGSHAIRAFLEDEALIYLGEFRGRATFAIDLDEKALERHAALRGPSLEEAAEFQDLRGVGALLPQEEAGLLAYARALVYWRSKHRYCGACGQPMHPRDAGHVMACRMDACGHQSFPRIDPAIIVLISDGERALLGRQAAWPAGRYSTLAGFVEPGESLEDAVIREMQEEAGVVVTDIRYHSSQPWPFPSSLMLGFTARALGTAITLNDAELEDARWFTRDEVARGAVGLPPPTSVSYRLIEHWLGAAPGAASRG